MSYSIEERVSDWSKSASTLVYEQALEDFTSDRERTPLSYSALSSRSKSKWGAIYSAFATKKTGAKKVKTHQLSMLADNAHMLDTYTQSEIDAILDGVTAEASTRKANAEKSGEAFRTAIAKVAEGLVNAKSMRVAPTDDLEKIKALVVELEAQLALV